MKIRLNFFVFMSIVFIVFSFSSDSEGYYSIIWFSLAAIYVGFDALIALLQDIKKALGK